MALEDWCLARVRVSGKEHKRISADDKLTFFQQLSTLVSSGTPLVEALRISAQQTQSAHMRELRELAGRLKPEIERRRVSSLFLTSVLSESPGSHPSHLFLLL